MYDEPLASGQGWRRGRETAAVPVPPGMVVEEFLRDI
jgi:hypothetical protein